MAPGSIPFALALVLPLPLLLLKLSLLLLPVGISPLPTDVEPVTLPLLLLPPLPPLPLLPLSTVPSLNLCLTTGLRTATVGRGGDLLPSGVEANPEAEADPEAEGVVAVGFDIDVDAEVRAERVLFGLDEGVVEGRL